MARTNLAAKLKAQNKGKPTSTSRPVPTKAPTPPARQPPQPRPAAEKEGSKTQKGKEKVTSSLPTKRSVDDAPASTPPPAKRGKGLLSTKDTMDSSFGLKLEDLKQLPLEELAEMYKLPKMPARRAPGISNEHSVIDHPESVETIRAFRSILFPRDQEYISDHSSAAVAQCAAYHFLSFGNMFYNILHRQRVVEEEVKEVIEKHNQELETAQERYDVAESKKDQLMKRISDLESEVGRIHSELKSEEAENAQLAKENFDLRWQVKNARVELEDSSRKSYEDGYNDG